MTSVSKPSTPADTKEKLLESSKFVDALANDDRKTRNGKYYSDLNHFVNSVGKCIFCKHWIPQTSPRALILIVHGYAEHCLRYERLASAFNDLGLLAFSQDHAGHGQSEGYQIDIPNYNQFLIDLLQHIEIMKKKYPGLPLYLYGHSMGGCISVLLASQHPDLFTGLVLSSPMIARNPEHTPFKVFLLSWLQHLLPRVPVATLDPNTISRDAEQVREYMEDPLLYTGPVRLRMAYQLYLLTHDARQLFADVTLPFLVLHGSGDELCPAAGSRELHQVSRSEDKEIEVFEDCAHELLHEIDDVPDRFLSRVMKWLADHMKHL